VVVLAGWRPRSAAKGARAYATPPPSTWPCELELDDAKRRVCRVCVAGDRPADASVGEFQEAVISIGD
jgi:hypothetical protein